MMNCVVEKIFPSQNPDGGSAYIASDYCVVGSQLEDAEQLP